MAQAGSFRIPPPLREMRVLWEEGEGVMGVISKHYFY